MLPPTLPAFARAWSLALLCAFSIALQTAANTRPPNIVLLFTDDQGYEDIGCFGSPLIRTPHLDQMADEGLRLTSFYSASPVCSPSRAALLTGCYPPRVGVTGVLFPRNDTGLHPDETTLPERLRAQGYATAHIGKWHLGHKPELLPTNHGFDHYYGIPYSNDMTLDQQARFAPDARFREGMTLEKARSQDPKKNWVPLMRDQEVIEYPADQSTLTQRYTREAQTFLTDHRERPFFLYLAYTMPHIPLFASESFAGQSPRGLYGDTIEEIDWSVGQILMSLKTLGIDEDTLVIYTSDNGPWKLNGGRGGSAYPLRGYKFSTWEGGMRVPCLMRWPGSLPAGQTRDQVLGTIDLLPTLVRLAGGTIPDEPTIDGRDIFETLRGNIRADTAPREYYYYRGRTLEAMRWGEWKFRETKEGTALYNLSRDISESENVAEAHPDRVDAMRARLRDFDRELKVDARPIGRAQTP